MEIDLGDLSAAPAPDRRAPRTLRPPPVVWLVLLAVLALGGSVPAAPQVRAVLVTDELPAAYDLAESALFTSGYRSTRSLVRRYSLTGGAVRWATELPQTVGHVRHDPAAGVVVVSSPEDAQTSILDSETGALLWRRTSGVTAVRRTNGDGTALMVSGAVTGESIVLERVTLRTGATRWSRALDADGFIGLGTGRPWRSTAGAARRS